MYLLIRVLSPMTAQLRFITPRSFVSLLRYTGYDDHVDAIQQSGDSALLVLPEAPIKVSLASF